MSSFERSKRRNFGESWWGQAWVEAIEGSAGLDSNRLPRGRTYARFGYVGDLEVKPGVVFALVEGSGSSPYRTSVRVKSFTDEQWNGLLDIVASKVAHSAALADGELTSEMIDDATAAGIEILPGDGEITTSCTCEDDANPCKHAAAVCYLFADLLDDDPFALLEVRGRSHEEIAAALRDRRKPESSSKVEVPAGGPDAVSAADAYGAYDPKAKLPKVPRPPRHPGEVSAALRDLPADAEVDASDLIALAVSGIHRAWGMSSGEIDSGRTWTVSEDLAWRASSMLADESAVYALAQRASVDGDALIEDARAWNSGGRDAFHDVNTPWTPTEAQLAQGVAALSELGLVSVEGNRVTCPAAGVQLLLGQSGRWYRLERADDTWRFEGVEDFDLV